MKRVTWFTAGVVAGAAGVEYARYRTRQWTARHTAGAVVRSAAGRARGRGQDLVDALREGRAAMRAKEAELVARRDGVTRSAVADVGGRVIVFETAVERAAVVGPRRRSRR